MIVTVTPNPSVDRTFEIEQLSRGRVVRALRHRVDPGGKGINVARALHANGHEVTAVVPVGGVEGDQLIQLLDAEGLDVVTVPISGAIRSNVAIVEPDGTVTKLNEPGPALAPDEFEALLGATVAAAREATWIVASGSLPPNAPTDLFARLVRLAAEAGVAAAVDTSGAALESALSAGPSLVKPNADELAEVTGMHLRTVGDVIDAARLVRAFGAGSVLASLGADGAVLVTPATVIHAELAVDAPNSSVGAGDAALAGFLRSYGDPAAGDPATALRAAVAFGGAAVRLPGSQLPRPADLHLEHVQVRATPDRTRALSVPAPRTDGALAPAPPEPLQGRQGRSTAP